MMTNSSVVESNVVSGAALEQTRRLWRQHSDVSVEAPFIERALLVGLELAKNRWVLAFGDGRNRRHVTIEGRDWKAFDAAVEQSKKKFELPDEAQIVVVQEAGRDGFWVHRYLVDKGVQSYVVDPASIPIPRRKRRRKTDRIDATLLLQCLVRFYLLGDRRVFSVVRVPDYEVQEQRLLLRERNRLVKEQTALRNRIKSKLAEKGLVDVSVNEDFPKRLTRFRTPGPNTELSPYLVRELERAYARSELVVRQLDEVEASIAELVKVGAELLAKHDEPVPEMVLTPAQKAAVHTDLLRDLRGIGLQSAVILAYEFFWRPFDKAKETGPAAGLIPSPFNTGQSSRDQGISKQGNRRVRALAIEIAWSWVRWQPSSPITEWFNRRFAKGSKRQRKIGIVGVARRLLAKLWSYLNHGTIPQDAILKRS